MPRAKLWAFLCCVLLVAGCSTPRDIKETPPLRTESMIDRDLLIEQGKKRSAEQLRYGPVVQEDNEGVLRQQAHRKITREEPTNVSELSREALAESFPVTFKVEHMDIRTFAQMLARVTDVNILVSAEAQGVVTAELSNVDWPHALDAMLKMTSLAKHVDSNANIIRIHGQERLLSLEDFDRRRRENLQRSLMVKRSSEPLYTEIFKLFYTEPEEVKTMVTEVLGVSRRTGSGGTTGLRYVEPEITTDTRKNLLIVKARKEDMEVIQKLVEEIDTRTAQVFIEAFIVEVTDDFEHAFGTRIGAQGSDTKRIGGKQFNAQIVGTGAGTAGSVVAGDTGSSLTNLALNNAFGGIGLLAGIGSAADLKLELSAMEAEGLSRVISNPRIFTLDNTEATIFQGDEVPYETTSQDGTKIEFKEAGLKLAVTPTVIGDGNLLMHIQVNKDTVDTSQSNPPITKSEIRTSLVSKDKEIVVIGGIYTENLSQSRDKVPGLGDVPGAGKLFRRDTNEDDRRELMIFIAPRIL